MSISFSSCADLRVYELIYTARTPSVYMIYRETSRQQLLASNPLIKNIDW